MTSSIGLLLDLDGTLLDTAPDMGRALNRLRIESDLPPLPPAEIRPVVSHGAARLIRLGFPEAQGDEFERLRRRFLEVYAQRVAEETQPFPGVLDVLEVLEQRDRPWGVVTNKPGWLTEPLMKRLGLFDRAGCVVSGDTLAERKPHPLPLLHAAQLIGVAPRHCVYVGDAERDIQAGRAAGMSTVVAAYGYIGSDDSPAEWHATGIIDHPRQLLDWIDAAEATL